MNIPVIAVERKSLAEAYEAALIALYEKGIRIKTQYDKPGDPESIDCTMNITILEPETDPMIHKAFPGGIEDLREYVMELKGFKDSWVKNMNDPRDTRWEYTYHGRLAGYGSWNELRDPDDPESQFQAGGFCIDQIQLVIDKLVNQPFTRQAQMITWMPNLDPQVYDPPCLQSIWYRILEDSKGHWWLGTNVRFRSNDAWGANFMNMFGLVQFTREVIANPIAEKSGRKVHLGRMNWQADSFHIYGKDIAAARGMLFDRLKTMHFSERTYDFHDPFIQEMYHGAEPAILRKIENYRQSHESR